jgi:hypothetical protein
VWVITLSTALVITLFAVDRTSAQPFCETGKSVFTSLYQRVASALLRLPR